MEDKILMTYALLAHLKETNKSDRGSLIKIFEPIVKKAIFEYAAEKGQGTIMGKNISEINSKITSFFGIEIPSGVLSIILKQISDDIKDENVFAYHNHGSFIIKSYIFNELDEDIKNELSNIKELQCDYKIFCEVHKCNYNFNELLEFIFALKIDLFTNSCSNVLSIDYSIPKYIKLKLKDDKFFKIISDIYLGNILSAYLNMKIDVPVTNTELLIDTNFFISLIDLNTEEAYLTCDQLYKLSKTLGFKFSILFSTVDQIKILLNSRIQDFANKELGYIKESDIFAACIRRNLDKTQLERIKDKLDSKLRELEIDVIFESRIKDIVEEAQKSQKYKDFIEVRNGNRNSALNDTVAYFYVRHKRGTHVQEFSDVKCWFLHNSYKTDYELNLGYKIHERNTINANELLTLLWLTNPGQSEINSSIIAKGGLATYIAKYRCVKMPSTELIKQINEKAKTALNQGKVREKDIYSIGIRMSEAHLINKDAEDLINLPDEKFITVVKEYTKQDEETNRQLSSQNSEIIEIKSILVKLSEDNKQMKRDNELLRYNLIISKYEKERDEYINNQLIIRRQKFHKHFFYYLLFILVLSFLWIIEKVYCNFINTYISFGISFILMIVPLVLRLFDHKTIMQSINYNISKKSREEIDSALKQNFLDLYEQRNVKPVFCVSDF